MKSINLFIFVSFFLSFCSLFELLIKKHDKIVEQLRASSALEPNGDLTQDAEVEHDDLVRLYLFSIQLQYIE